MRQSVRFVLTIGAAIALLVGCGGSQTFVGPAPNSSSVTPNSAGSKTFHYTGSEQWFTVPKGVSWLTVIALGARGGGEFFQRFGRYGGRVRATIPVKPGERLAVYVGGATSYGGGGFNGGAPGGGDAVAAEGRAGIWAAAAAEAAPHTSSQAQKVFVPGKDGEAKPETVSLSSVGSREA